MTRFLLLPDSCCLLTWGALWRQDGSVLYTAVETRQLKLSRVRVQQDSWPYFISSNLKSLQPGGPDPSIYIPQEQGGPVMSLGTEFPFRRLLRLTGPWWKYSTRLHTRVEGECGFFCQLNDNAEAEVMLQPPLCRLVCLGVGHPSGA
jgi:hypothetical protein